MIVRIDRRNGVDFGFDVLIGFGRTRALVQSVDLRADMQREAVMSRRADVLMTIVFDVTSAALHQGGIGRYAGELAVRLLRGQWGPRLKLASASW